MNSFVVDTSVLAEYLDEESPYRNLLERFYSDVRSGRFYGYITHVTIAELIFVATRIYREAGVEHPNAEALRYITWLINVAGFNVVSLNIEDSILAGELRKKLRIAIADRFVIAVARRLGANPLFLRLEREMRKFKEILREYNVVLIDEVYPS